MKEPKKTVYLQLPIPLYEKVSRLAQECGRTIPNYIRWNLKRHLEHLDEGFPEKEE